MLKRGLSEVITAVLMILLVVAAVMIIWAVLRPMIVGSLQDVTTICMSANLKINSAEYLDGAVNTLTVNVQRGAGASEITLSDIKFLLDSENIDDKLTNPIDDVKLEELEGGTFVFDFSGMSNPVGKEVQAAAVVPHSSGDKVCAVSGSAIVISAS